MHKLLITLLAAFAWMGAAAADLPRDAHALVAGLGDKALAVVSDKSASNGEQANRFRALLLENFDVPAIGRFVLGRYWRTATPEQQKEYLELFERMIVQTYVNRFREYSGETFKVVEARREDDEYALVISDIVRPQGPPVKVEWRVQKTSNGPRIVDVIVEGVSLSVTQRGDFTSVIQNGGGKVDALISMMRQRVR
ncbi:MAG: ABC transporter substrate-binding protein [Thalassobaculales bacterium]